MAFAGTVLNVFIASPGDTKAERDVIETALHHWNSLRGKRERVILLPRRWERDASRGLSGPAQQSINTRLVDQSDILLAVLDTKLGTATPNYVSGTAEEILRAHSAGIPVHVWFSREAISRDADPEELKRLQEFEKTLRDLGVLGEYSTLDDLAWQVQDEIERDLDERDMTSSVEPPSATVPNAVVDELATRLNDAIEEAHRAKAESLILFSDLLAPIIRQLGQVISLPADERAADAHRLVATVLASRSLLFPLVPDVRMVAYRIVSTPHSDELIVDDWAGRPRDEPRPFVSTDGGRGAAALTWLRSDARQGPRFTPDTTMEKDPNWRGTGRGYLTYVSIPLVVQEEVYGMLTVDAPRPGDLDETDLPVLQVLGQCIALGYSLS